MKERLDSPSDEEQPPAIPNHPTDGLPASHAPDRPTWTFRDTMVGVLLTLAPWLALAAFSLVQSPAQQVTAKPLSPGVDIANAVVSLIVQAVLEGTFLIAPLWFAVFKPRRWARQHGTREPGWHEGLGALGFRSYPASQTIRALVVGALAIFAASYLYAAITQALNVPNQTNVEELLKRAATEPWTTLATLIVAVIVAPFCEEVFFRGYFFQGLRLRIAVWPAIVISAVIFGLAHGDLGSLVLLIVIGGVLAVVRWRTRSLWPGVALHILNNSLGAIIILQALRF